jgi:hypothetical protein
METAMWEDKIWYWAWRGEQPCPPDGPPSTKRIEYATVTGQGRYLNGPQQGEIMVQRLGIGIRDGDRYTPINRGHGLCEVEWWRKHGAEVQFP